MSAWPVDATGSSDSSGDGAKLGEPVLSRMDAILAGLGATDGGSVSGTSGLASLGGSAMTLDGESGSGAAAVDAGHPVQDDYAWYNPLGWGPRAYNWLWGTDTGFGAKGDAPPDVPGNELINSVGMINKRLDAGGLTPGAAPGALTENKDKNFNQRMSDVGQKLGKEFPVFAAGVMLELGSLVIGPEDVILLGVLKAKGLVVGVKGLTKGGKKVLGIFTKAGGDKLGAEVVGDELKALEAEVKAAKTAAVGVHGSKGITTPSSKLQQWAQQGGYIDPRTNKLVSTAENLAADHVYPKSLIKRLPGFDRLSTAQQEWLLNYPGNFEPLPKSWNSSKLNRLADDWAKTPMGRQASKGYIDALRERQQAFEGFARNMIDFWLGN